MSFAWPAMLAGVVIVPLLIAFRSVQLRRARRKAASFAGFGAPVQSGQGSSFVLRPAWFLLLCGLSLLMVAMARPAATVGLPRLGGTIILAFDVSGSMAADDLKPTRMEAAKQAAQQFVEKQPSGVQLGVVAFSDSGLSVQVPTDDREAVQAAITRLSPQRGTSLANGILVSLNAIAASLSPAGTNYYSNNTPVPAPTPTPMPAGQFASAAIVMLSDGENNQRPDPLLAAKAASDRGVRVYTIGVGSAAGSLLHVEGLTIRSRLDEPMLKQLASLTGGTYFNAPTESELMQIYSNLKPELSIKPEQTEITALVAGAGMVLLLAAALSSMLTVGRVP